MSQIIDHMGELSAVAQKLSKPVTSSQKLRMVENQTVYVMADINGCDGDVVIGLLKVGAKNLYLFDNVGDTRKVDQAPCILDFYIHETRQRTGLGKRIFDFMLAEENWIPVKCTVDRPSEKLLKFLKKYYGLETIIPQTNKFVLYEGFFEKDGTKDNNADVTTVCLERGSNEMWVVSAYMPHGDVVDPPPAILGEITAEARRRGVGVIIGADANAHHSIWGSSDTNTRGSK
ncbi:alpha-tubulin N-acetyltransferase 1-like isoform X5 [Eurosta solidaginis]